MYQTAFPVINLEETGRNIERYRRQAQLTVRDLQTYFGFEYPQAIYKWQHGECLPTVDNLLALARLLRVSMEDLLVCEEDREAVPFYTAIRCQSVLGSELNPRLTHELRVSLFYYTSITKYYKSITKRIYHPSCRKIKRGDRDDEVL